MNYKAIIYAIEMSLSGEYTYSAFFGVSCRYEGSENLKKYITRFNGLYVLFLQ